MGKDIFDSILEKNYSDLSPQELTEITPFCSDEQSFLAMKEVLSHTKTIAAGSKLTPLPSKKEELDKVFEATFGQSSKKAFYFQPLFQVAAALLISFAVWMFIDKAPKSTVQLAENKVEDQYKQIEETSTTQKDELENISNENEVTLRESETENKSYAPLAEKSITKKNENTLNDDISYNKQTKETSVAEQIKNINHETMINEDSFIPVASSPSSAAAKSSYRTQSTSADYITSNSDSNPFALKIAYSVSLEKQQKVLDFLVPNY